MNFWPNELWNNEQYGVARSLEPHKTRYQSRNNTRNPKCYISPCRFNISTVCWAQCSRRWRWWWSRSQGGDLRCSLHCLMRGLTLHCNPLQISACITTNRCQVSLWTLGKHITNTATWSHVLRQPVNQQITGKWPKCAKHRPTTCESEQW